MKIFTFPADWSSQAPVGMKHIPMMKRMMYAARGVRTGFQEGRDCCRKGEPDVHTVQYIH